MTVLLVLVSIAAVVLFVGVLCSYLVGITRALDRIGGQPTSYLAKIRMGVRAIEVETGHLPSLVPPINEQLAGIAGGLRAVDAKLVETAAAAVRQGGGGT